jgi:hypothetical protein
MKHMLRPAQIVFMSERRALGFVQHDGGFTTFHITFKPSTLKVGDVVPANWSDVGRCLVDVAGVRHEVNIQHTHATFEAALRAVGARKNRDTRRHLRQERLSDS